MTIYEDLQAAGLPVISADESGAISMGPMTLEQQRQFEDIILEHFQPAEYAKLLQWRIDRETIKNGYTDMIVRLEQIQAASNPTTAQVVQAVKDEALYIERIMKFLKNMLG